MGAPVYVTSWQEPYLNDWPPKIQKPAVHSIAIPHPLTQLAEVFRQMLAAVPDLEKGM